MYNKEINRILQIIERVENNDKELLFENTDFPVNPILNNKFFKQDEYNQSKGFVYDDEDFTNGQISVTIVAFMSDERLASSGKRLQNNFWIIYYNDEYWVIDVAPRDFSDPKKRVEDQKNGSGKILSTYYIEFLNTRADFGL